MAYIVIIDKNTDKKSIKVNDFDLKSLHKLLKNKNKISNFNKLYVWDFDDEKVEVYGYNDGIEKNINRLEFPNLPLSEKLYYDELIFITRDLDNKVTDFKEDDFDEFYDCIFDGFEDIEDTDNFSDLPENDEYISDGGFVVLDE